VIAAITLLERKFLALLQRRVGPNYVGYRGRLQYIADALKLLLKQITLPENISKNKIAFLLFFVQIVCFFFWVNSVWGPSLLICDIEYNLIYMIMLSIIFNFCVILMGYFSKNKYGFLASIRGAIMSVNLEILFGAFILNLVLLSNSFSFLSIVYSQENYWNIFIMFILFGFLIIIFLLEINRAPFDLIEAEAELVTGYSVEIGGFYFGLYYLGEYFHLFFSSLYFSIFLFGGWHINLIGFSLIEAIL
jgi:NADH:ubiquinone oxidoreductase subunit H